jgi:nucleoside-diphosphate-sugar epimerase
MIVPEVLDDESNRSSVPTDRPVERVAVIGGAGFLGSVVVRSLLELGFGVTVMDAFMYGDEGLSDLYDTTPLEVIRGDLRSIESTVAAAHRADALVHLGAVVGDPACAYDEQLALEVNVGATETVAAVARGLGIRRFVFASTCAVYGASSGTIDEDAMLDPVSLYAKTKADSERILLSVSGDTFAPVVLRFGTLFGASPRPRFDLVVNLLTAKAIQDGEIVVQGGEQWRPFVHVRDAAEAVVRCLTVPEEAIRRRVFNIGSADNNHTLRDIAEMIVDEIPGTSVGFAPGVPEASYRVSFDRAREDLGFVAARSVRDGVREIRDQFQEGELGSYRDARYSNIGALATGATAVEAADVAAEPTALDRS